MMYALFDIGGTKTRIGISADLKTLDKVYDFKTPAAFEDGMKKMVGSITKLSDGKKLTAIAGGVRGLLNEEKTGIENDPTLAKWAGKSIVDELKKEFSCDVYLENDAAMAALGEAIFGAGKGLDIVAYHTVSTGVGGARIDNGEIDHASIGFEPGKQILDIDRTVLGDDIAPTLENLVSGTAIEERYGTKPYEIPQSDVLWEELAEYLAQGLRNTTLYWSPEVIVLGGSMIIGDPKIKIEAIRKYVVNALEGIEPAPFITKAKLGDESGLYGAMALLLGKQSK
jgi:predicted NBD/HSP70 family sugar kinase